MTANTATGPSLTDPALITDPYGGYSRLREEAPVLLGRRIDGAPAWYVTRHDDVRTVLSDPRFVVNPASVPGVTVDNVREKIVRMMGIPAELAGYITESILELDGLDHLRLRRQVSRAFTARRVNGLRPRIEEITSALLGSLGGSADVVAEFAYPLAVTVICELVGVPEGEREDWRRWGSVLQPLRPDAAGPALREMVDYTHDLIGRRRADPADDLITDLVRVQDEGGDRLSDAEMVALVLALVLSGQETTVHLISNATYALLTNPDQLELLRREADLWPVAVQELMRWCGPILLTRLRYATEDIELGGVRLHAGDAVQAVLVSANFDPREHADPERLDVTRQPASKGEGHAGFGHGSHYCLGAALARLEAEVALRGLFERFPGLTLASDEPEWVPLPGVRRQARLQVRL